MVATRQTRSRRLATALRWPVGVTLTAWRYLWRTTPIYRDEVASDWSDFPTTRLPTAARVYRLSRTVRATCFAADIGRGSKRALLGDRVDRPRRRRPRPGRAVGVRDLSKDPRCRGCDGGRRRVRGEDGRPLGRPRPGLRTRAPELQTAHARRPPRSRRRSSFGPPSETIRSFSRSRVSPVAATGSPTSSMTGCGSARRSSFTCGPRPWSGW